MLRSDQRGDSDARETRSVSLSPTAICVLMGGPSAEHEVSLVSGRAIATALRRAAATT